MGLRAFELGAPLSPSLTFRAELTLFTHYHPTPEPFATQFGPHPTTSVLRNAHITQIAGSVDRALSAVASTDGRVELHEPAATDSHRMTLEPVNAQSRLSGVAFMPATTQQDDDGATKSTTGMNSKGTSDVGCVGDALIATASNCSAIYYYDLNKCRVDRPTAQLRFRTEEQKPVTDVATIGRYGFVAARPGALAVFDVRSSRVGEVLAAAIPCKDPVLTGLGDFLIVAEGDRLLTYDRRRLPTGAVAARAARALTMARPSDSAVAVLPLPLPKHARYNWVTALPRGPPAFLAFHATDGTFGTVDLASRSVATVKEHSAAKPDIAADLPLYGTMEAALSRTAWYIRRRRGDIVHAPYGRGWRVLVPHMLSTGLRAIAFGPNLPLQQFSIPAARHVDVACVHAVDGLLDKLLLGTTRNEVRALQVDIDRTWNRKA